MLPSSASLDVKPPVGYMAGVKDGPSMVHDPERGPLIREAFVLFSSGLHTAQQVLKRVTKMGLRTARGKPLGLQTFTQMLRKPVYAGLLKVTSKAKVKGEKGISWGEPVRGNFQPLVEQRIFDDVQAVLAGKRPRLTAYQKCHPDFPLRRFVRCGCCDRPLTGSFTLGRGGRRYAYYHCFNKACKGVGVRKEELERAFLAYLERLQPKAGYMRLFREVVLDVWRQRQQENVLTSVTLGQRVEALQERLERLHETFIYQRAIDQATYESQKHKLEEELTLVEMELREAKADECDVEGVLTFAEHVILNAARLWTEFSLE